MSEIKRVDIEGFSNVDFDFIEAVPFDYMSGGLIRFCKDGENKHIYCLGEKDIAELRRFLKLYSKRQRERTKNAS